MAVKITNIILILILGFGRVQAQRTISYEIYGGPSITNDLLYWNDELTRLLPKNPLPSLTMHMGGTILSHLNDRFDLFSCLYFERRASSREKILFGYTDIGDFLGVSLGGDYRPIEEKAILFELGMSADYLVRRNISFPYNTRWEYCGLLGVRYNWNEKYGFRFRWEEALFYRSKYSPIDLEDRVSLKSQSFQFSFIHKLNSNE